MGEPVDHGPDLLDGEEPVVISNEFAVVEVRKVYTRNGERLEIAAPKLGRAIRLDPLELESLTWQEHPFFSQLLRSPLGPAPEDR